jgi:hypothetical protein
MNNDEYNDIIFLGFVHIKRPITFVFVLLSFFHFLILNCDLASFDLEEFEIFFHK